MSGTHTMGRWACWDDGRTIGIEGEAIVIAEVVDHGDLTPETQLVADQRLIAAAPCLLEALAALRNHLSGTPRPSTLLALLVNADLAIAKARGDS